MMRPRVVDDVVRSDLTDGEVVVSIRGGERALILNAMADAILDLCDGTLSVDEIERVLRETLSVPPGADLGRDVRTLIDELTRAGFIQSS